MWSSHASACQREKLVKRMTKLKLAPKLTLVFVSFAAAILTVVGLSLFGAVSMWIVYSFLSGRRQTLRLTDPSPIDEQPESLVKA